MQDSKKIKAIGDMPKNAINGYKISGDVEYYPEKLIVSLYFEFDYTRENEETLEKILKGK